MLCLPLLDIQGPKGTNNSAERANNTPGTGRFPAGVCLWAVRGATELRVFTVVAFCAAWNGGGVL